MHEQCSSNQLYTNQQYNSVLNNNLRDSNIKHYIYKLIYKISLTMRYKSLELKTREQKITYQFSHKSIQICNGTHPLNKQETCHEIREYLLTHVWDLYNPIRQRPRVLPIGTYVPLWNVHSKKVSNFKAYIFPLFSTWFEAATRHGGARERGQPRYFYNLVSPRGSKAPERSQRVAARSYARASQEKKGIVRGVSRYRSVGKALVSSRFLLFARRGRKGVGGVFGRATASTGTANKTRGCRGRDMSDNETNGRAPLK